MKKITIAFSKPSSRLAIVSLLIRIFERSKFSHALIRWKSDALQREMVYHASHGMVHFIEGSRFDTVAETVAAYEIDLTESQHLQVVQKAVDLAGVKYGFLTLIGIAFERITKIRNPFRDQSKSFICSELVGEILKICEKTQPLDLERAGPKQLEAWIAGLQSARKIK